MRSEERLGKDGCLDQWPLTAIFFFFRIVPFNEIMGNFNKLAFREQSCYEMTDLVVRAIIFGLRILLGVFFFFFFCFV